MLVLGQICTRVFGQGLDSTCLIPMADNLNHSHIGVTNELINTSLHPTGDANPQYYRIERYLADYSTLFPNSDLQNIKGRFSRKVYENNQKALSI